MPHPYESQPHRLKPLTGVKATDVKVIMDGKGRWVDNVFIECLWHSVKYEEVYLKAYGSVAEARSGIGGCLRFYNTERKHQGIEKTPDQAYFGEIMWQKAA